MVAALHGAGEVPGGTRHGGVVADATRLPFADASFDRVIASEVLEHLVDDEAAIAELARVLKRGGLAALSVPAAGPERANWALSADYHQVDGGSRPHLPAPRARRPVRAGRAAVRRFAPRARAALAVLAPAVRGRHRPRRPPLVAAYHRLLVWDITRRPAVTRALEKVLNPLIGKSLVVYVEKSA